jgi:hypothetical protein
LLQWLIKNLPLERFSSFVVPVIMNVDYCWWLDWEANGKFGC